VSDSLSPVERRDRRRRAKRRVVRLRLIGVGFLLIVVAAVGVIASGGGKRVVQTPTRLVSEANGPARAPAVTHVTRRTILVERQTGRLVDPVQDASSVSVGGQALLLGGLTASDLSTDQVVIASAAGARVAGHLPSARHDTAAAAIGRFAYLFGGGNGVSQLAEILRIDPSTGAVTVAGHLPAASSDSSGAAIGDTAYVVGGYTGTQWLDTIVAWRPGTNSRIVARLPSPLRYAAVASAGGRLVIAGGSLESGAASSAVYEFTPGDSAPIRIGTLPAPITHAAAAALGRVVYVVGGRGAALDSPTTRIVAIDLGSRQIREAGSLTSARSDLTAVSIGNRILVAGGRGPEGTESTVSELTPVQVAVSSTRRSGTANVDVYAHDGANMLTAVTKMARPLVYVPNSQSNTVDVIDPATYRVVEHFAVGALPQHVVPAWNLRTLYVTNDAGNSLTPIDPRTGRPGASIPVADPYNMYFTPDGLHAIIVAERLERLDFRNPRTFALQNSVPVPCVGIDHMDFSAAGSYLIASCEFSGQLVKVDVASERVVGTLTLPDGPGAMPQDVKLSADGRIFYVADGRAGGVWEVDGSHMRVVGFIRTGAGAHGLYPSRSSKFLYVTNRTAGSISVISFATRKVVARWRIPGGGSPDMGGVSANGRVLWVSGRYNGLVYAISTVTGRLLARIPVGQGPHGLCVWPQPGRYSLGHTGILR
jgi:YVTN family beta-propeller protein